MPADFAPPISRHASRASGERPLAGRRIAALYDIHGNLPALEAVLDVVRRESFDLVVVGGDVVPGPMPSECLSCLLDLDVELRCLQGNGEIAVLSARVGEDPGVPERVRESIAWVASELSNEQAAVLASWPATVRIQVDSAGETLFCHATPRSATEIFTRLSPEERLLPVFDGRRLRGRLRPHPHAVRSLGRRRARDQRGQRRHAVRRARSLLAAARSRRRARRASTTSPRPPRASARRATPGARSSRRATCSTLPRKRRRSAGLANRKGRAARLEPSERDERARGELEGPAACSRSSTSSSSSTSSRA